MYDEPKYSPWGSVQDCTTMLDGVFSVGTAGHGGILVKREIAEDILSEEAQKCGFVEGSFLCFEEDCDAAVVERELLDKNLWEIPSRVKDKERYDESLNSSLKRNLPEYWEVYTANKPNHENNRFIVHDYLIGNTILIDKQDKTASFYRQNIHGQFYDLESPETVKIDARKINGLIERTKNPNYGLKTSKAVDGYIYEYLMNDDQKARCGRKPSILLSEKIVVADDFKEAIEKMCDWANEKKQSVDRSKKPSITSKLQESVKETKQAVSVGEKKQVSKGVEI